MIDVVDLNKAVCS